MKHPLILLAILWLAANSSNIWYPTPDGCGYLSIARELATTGTFRNLNSPQLYYPIGYSLLIAPAFLIDDEPFWLISIIHFLLGLVLIWLIYTWAREYVPVHAPWLVLLAVGSASFGNIYRRTLSETLFMLLCFATARSMMNVLKYNRGKWSTMLLMMALILTRPAGAMLAVGFATVVALGIICKEISLRRGVLLGLLVVPAALLQFAMMQRDRAIATELNKPTYTAQIRDPSMNLGEQLLEGVRLRVQECGRVLLPGMYKSYARAGVWWNINMMLYTPLAIVAGIGWYKFVRNHRDVLMVTLPWYVLLYVVWPYDQSTRFFTPIVPLLALAVVTFPWRFSQDRIRKIGATIAILHLGVAVGYWLFSERPTALAQQRAAQELREVIQHIPIAEQNAVGVSRTFGDEFAWLQFLINREVQVIDVGKPITKIRWLLLKPQDDVPTGWSLITVHRNGIRLTHRNP